MHSNSASIIIHPKKHHDHQNHMLREDMKIKLTNLNNPQTKPPALFIAHFLIFIFLSSCMGITQASPSESIKIDWSKQLKKYQILSSKRNSDEHFKEVADRYRQLIKKRRSERRKSIIAIDESTTAYDEARPIEFINDDILDNWNSQTQLDNAFISARDSQFIPWKYSLISKYRRPTWLFPYDGCHVRAEQLKDKFNEYGFPEVKKIFVFGDLSFNTKNSLLGKVQWWFHVAVATKFNDQIYVFDPAIDASKILPLEDWGSSFNQPIEALTFSICNKNTYIPFDGCNNPEPIDQQEYEKVQTSYLFLESINLVTLGRNPLIELQDNPPWRKPVHVWQTNRRGMKGDIYIHYNKAIGKAEYFQLVNVNFWGQYGDFPNNQQNNHYWKYLGNDAPQNYLQPLKTTTDQKNNHKAGDIFITRSHSEVEYYRLIEFQEDGSLADFPSDQQDNPYWEYLGNDYPIELKNDPEQVTQQLTGEVGSIFKYQNPIAHTVEYFRLSI